MSQGVDQQPERFIPSQMRGDLVEAEHLVRYRWVSQLAAGRRALDAGCGMGYGTEMLHDAGAPATHGIDIAADAIEAARPNVSTDVTLVEGDLSHLPFADGSFDLAVCFEVIEHIEARGAALDELARVLASGGILALSSPNRNEYPSGNPHHVFEYTPEELRAEAEARFPFVVTYRQQDWTAAAILDDDQFGDDSLRSLAVDMAKVTARAPGSETFTIVVASDTPLPAMTGHSVLTGALELRRWLALYAEQHDVLARQHEVLAADRDIDDELASVHHRLREAEQELVKLTELRQQTLDAKRDRDDAVWERKKADDRADLAKDRADRAEVVNQELMNSVSWKLTWPLRRLKGSR